MLTTYALLKLLHLLAIVVWVGGMFFALYCLRPAAMSLSPPVRVPLMAEALGRFFTVVTWASLLAVGSGFAMVMMTVHVSRDAGVRLNVPLDWWVMASLGLAMLAVFAHVRLGAYPRLRAAVAAQDWPAGGAQLASIRRWVTLNLVLGALILAAVTLGTAG